ncbi:uracil phosphoribosyltransferase homolog isoform X2 [Pogonomyrmex barbatus]|uniref:Uracil phosphoribosyltransferase homolog isoform X2 n=1 Tax=Pogonomyrmex barbatus TaxID=144034 RepID=A0A8N1S6W3_9HYME|nr:uracil phosphoribosyltransferase homolog isoform X2 [Pogonomyrmex barbatus]
MDIEALQNKVTAKSRACPLSGDSLIQGLNPMFPRVVHRSFQTACSRMQARGRFVCGDEVMECNGVIRENHNSSIAIHNRSAGTIDDTWCDASVMGSTDTTTKLLNDNHEIDDHEYGTNLKILPCNNQVKELQTILRDKNTTRSDFKFYADRLIRLVIEESLNQLPFTKCVVTTPTGAKYKGLKYQKGNCGVSIVRSGEAMEQGLRDCCRSIRIGKILVESDADTHEARVVYAKFPDDISERKVLLMYPIMKRKNDWILPPTSTTLAAFYVQKL